MIQARQPKEEEIRRHYDELDDFYRELWGVNLHHGLWQKGDESKEEAAQALTLKVLGSLKGIENKTLLDIGCGYGKAAELAILKGGAKEARGITLSKRQQAYAQSRNISDAITIDFGDFLANDYSNSVFDHAYSIECFSHLKNKRRFFEETSRVLKPSGRLAFTAWLSSENPSFYEKKLLLEPICSEGRLPSLYSKDEVIKTIGGSGLHFKKFEDLTNQVQRTWEVALKEASKLIFTRRGFNYILNNKNTERKFIITVARILAAYKNGCFRYGLFLAENYP